MTDMEQALTVSGIIFGVVMLSQFGRRRYNFHKIMMPIVSVVVIGYFYLKDMPTDRVDWAVYGVGAVIGLAFGAIATAATGLERGNDGKLYTRCGAGFVTAWLTVVAIRIAFIALADHNQTFRNHLGQFMMDNKIVEAAIPPFFVIMALVMVISRVAMMYLRVSALRTQPAAFDAPRQVATAR